MLPSLANLSCQPCSNLLEPHESATVGVLLSTTTDAECAICLMPLFVGIQPKDDGRIDQDFLNEATHHKYYEKTFAMRNSGGMYHTSCARTLVWNDDGTRAVDALRVPTRDPTTRGNIAQRDIDELEAMGVAGAAAVRAGAEDETIAAVRAKNGLVTAAQAVADEAIAAATRGGADAAIPPISAPDHTANKTRSRGALSTYTMLDSNKIDPDPTNEPRPELAAPQEVSKAIRFPYPSRLNWKLAWDTQGKDEALAAAALGRPWQANLPVNFDPMNLNDRRQGVVQEWVDINEIDVALREGADPFTRLDESGLTAFAIAVLRCPTTASCQRCVEAFIVAGWQVGMVSLHLAAMTMGMRQLMVDSGLITAAALDPGRSGADEAYMINEKDLLTRWLQELDRNTRLDRAAAMETALTTVDRSEGQLYYTRGADNLAKRVIFVVSALIHRPTLLAASEVLPYAEDVEARYLQQLTGSLAASSGKVGGADPDPANPSFAGTPAYRYAISRDMIAALAMDPTDQYGNPVRRLSDDLLAAWDSCIAIRNPNPTDTISLTALELLVALCDDADAPISSIKRLIAYGSDPQYAMDIVRARGGMQNVQRVLASAMQILQVEGVYDADPLVARGVAKANLFNRRRPARPGVPGVNPLGPGGPRGPIAPPPTVNRTPAGRPPRPLPPVAPPARAAPGMVNSNATATGTIHAISIDSDQRTAITDADLQDMRAVAVSNLYAYYLEGEYISEFFPNHSLYVWSMGGGNLAAYAGPLTTEATNKSLEAARGRIRPR